MARIFENPSGAQRAVHVTAWALTVEYADFRRVCLVSDTLETRGAWLGGRQGIQEVSN